MRRLSIVLLLVFPDLAFAHGSGLFVLAVGVPSAFFAYLIGAALLLRSARPGHRSRRAWCLVAGLPIWMAFYILPWFSYETIVSPYENEWSIALPAGLVAIAFLLTIIQPQE